MITNLIDAKICWKKTSIPVQYKSNNLDKIHNLLMKNNVLSTNRHSTNISRRLTLVSEDEQSFSCISKSTQYTHIIETTNDDT